MKPTNGTATILDMNDARKRLSGEPGAQYETAGAWLAATREASGLTLAEAADKTHIRERHLGAIETYEFANLPPRPYAIGFVRSYATFLELDADAVVARFKDEAEYGAPAPVEPDQFATAARAEPVEKPELSLSAVIVIIAFIVWCAWQLTLPHEVRRLGAADDASAAAEGAARSTVAPTAPEPVEVIPARLVERVAPVYPLGCVNAAAPVETVLVAFTVTADGRVSSERVARASNGCFGDAALNAVRRWRYEPRRVEGAARPAYDQRVELTFERPL